ncbi:hypothetical protein GLOTRDRAFT_89936 [Gloeophyllum trabeum ATCC 11539]|uniref:RNase H type-1 domain-containing protein n=1 Tax=Gloeophyllum trabeum (strain ATCC 11539 / FP-39264 / Madison 617) TaxID=670483 RepID=S7S3K3_GLOTA|nr:uncharacterized protein GLOTRDRAFT_89936 [Gloeophyllum trabeum ATCC 11539]EPQ60414.1 hypothetical protein GLOTRDRAFT_89936 [Gloeophyllum trabeum ATCC 11539]
MPVSFMTDSLYVINGVTKNLACWEDTGWTRISNQCLFKAAAYQLRIHSAATSFTWVKGHHQNPGNDEAHKLAKRGAKKDVPDQLVLTVPPTFDPVGAKMWCLTQALAYRAIRARKTAETPPQTQTQ